jgi:hypothetical protein
VTVPATVSYTVDFARPARPEAAPEHPGRVLRVARLLALAHQIDAKVRAGEYDHLADAARNMGLTRARVTQIVNLTLLAPEIQKAILTWPAITEGRDPITERTLRASVAEPDWATQAVVWRRARVPLPLSSGTITPPRPPALIHDED